MSAEREHSAGDRAITPAVTAAPPVRLASLDQLRGLVIVLMALDHIRDFFHASAYQGENPLDVDHTSIVLYATRWLTHLCAPTFVFLAGTSAFWRGHTSGASFTRRSRAELSRFLLTRGLWLIVLEVTVISWFGWYMSVEPGRCYLQVVWALGASMVVLAGLIWLPHWLVAAIGIAIVALHNLIGGWSPGGGGGLAALWHFVYAPGSVRELTAVHATVSYPVLPWLGIMTLGYAFGPIAMAPVEVRRRWLLALGASALAAFVVLRGLNLYGDPAPWTAHGDWLRSLGAILDVRKYPPSLSYVLVTLGIVMLLWRWLDRGAPRALRWLGTFGAVPMFVYLIHLPLVHGLAALLHQLVRGDGGWLIGARYMANGDGSIGGRGSHAIGWPEAPGFSLGVVYLVWIGVIMMLYPAARWFAGVKRRHRTSWWVSYL